MILRELIAPERAGGDVFFGEPEFDTADLLRVTPDGTAVDRDSAYERLPAEVTPEPEPEPEPSGSAPRRAVGRATS